MNLFLKQYGQNINSNTCASLLINQSPLKHPPVLQLLAKFLGQSGEKFDHCAKKFGPFKIKFLGLQVLKSWSKFGHRIFGLSICFQHFF